jgi:hypothetical protein
LCRREITLGHGARWDLARDRRPVCRADPAQQPRITYWLAPGLRIILLTAFRKTRSAEAAEVARALQAQKTCQAEHGPAHDTSTGRHPDMTSDPTSYVPMSVCHRARLVEDLFADPA